MQYLILLVFFLFPACAFAGQTHEYTLQNGLKIIVKEDHRAPVVTSQICYKVGSSYEHGGITGISHALEHMMFKGTPRYPANKLSKTMSRNGMVFNAFTSTDYTCYFEALAPDKLALSFDMEADRMQNLTISPQEFSKEIQVVMEERRMRTDDNPRMRTYERFNSAAFISSPYHHLPIGWMNDLQQMKADDLKQWYKQWIAPNNAVLVVVGDVEPTKVLALATQYFGKIPPAKLPLLKSQLEIAPLGKREVIVKTPAELPWTIIGYNVPSLKTSTPSWHAYALEVLSNILNGGESARLPKSLVRGMQIANDTDVNYDLYNRLDGLFTISATPSAGHSVEKLETALLAQVDRLQKEKVDAKELERAKTQLIANKRYSLDSQSDQANEIGALESINLPWQIANQYSENVRAITAEQLQLVARKYLTQDRLTLGILEPLPIDHPVKEMIEGDTKHVH